ncbi:MAG: VCBS repeat-containing protein [Planctomycetota bacterium]
MSPIGSLLLLVLLARTDVPFVESLIRLPGEIRNYETPDVNDDDRGDLVVILADEGIRTLCLFLQRADGRFPEEPDWRLTVPPEVVAYSFFDLREEPGRELLLLTGGGVHSLSTTRPGLRGNLRQELRAGLFPDLPAPDELPRWGWTADLFGDGRKELLLVRNGQMVAYQAGQDEAGTRKLIELGSIPCRQEEEKAVGEIELMGGQATIRTVSPVATLFPGVPSTVPSFGRSSLLNRTEEWLLPALVDWNGDGLVDGVRPHEAGITRFLLQRDGSFLPGEQVLVEPEQVQALGGDIRLIDMDGDGSVEVVALDSEQDGLTGTYTVTVLPKAQDGSALLPAVARIKLEASHVRFRFEDVNHDGREDLVARATRLPSAIQTLTSAYIDMSLLVFLGEEGGALARSPSARFERRMPVESFTRVRESQFMELGGDYDGDGLNDLLMLRADGLLQIFPLKGDGGKLAFSTEPMSTFLPSRAVRDARPAVMSKDGVSDLILRHEDALTVFVSKREAEER